MKKIISMLLILVFAFTFALPTFADEKVTPRAAICGNCGTGQLLEVLIKTYEVSPNWKPCIHYTRGEDNYKDVYGEYQLDCTNSRCSFKSAAYTRLLSSQLIACHGYY